MSSKHTRYQRDQERLIAEAIRSQSTQDFENESEYYFKVNLYIMKKLLKLCPPKHLIVLTHSGKRPVSTFEKDKNNLIATVRPDDKTCKDCSSSTMCFNPRICSDATWIVEQFNSEINPDSNIIMFWEFVPYPAHWNWPYNYGTAHIKSLGPCFRKGPSFYIGILILKVVKLFYKILQFKHESLLHTF